MRDQGSARPHHGPVAATAVAAASGRGRALRPARHTSAAQARRPDPPGPPRQQVAQTLPEPRGSCGPPAADVRRRLLQPPPRHGRGGPHARLPDGRNSPRRRTDHSPPELVPVPVRGGRHASALRRPRDIPREGRPGRAQAHLVAGHGRTVRGARASGKGGGGGHLRRTRRRQQCPRRPRLRRPRPRAARSRGHRRRRLRHRWDPRGTGRGAGPRTARHRLPRPQGRLPRRRDTRPPARGLRRPRRRLVARRALPLRRIRPYHPELTAFADDFEARHHLPVERIYVAKMLYGLLARTEEGTFPPGTTLAAVITGQESSR